MKCMIILTYFYNYVGALAQQTDEKNVAQDIEVEDVDELEVEDEEEETVTVPDSVNDAVSAILIITKH